jgi:hypothetical protein
MVTKAHSAKIDTDTLFNCRRFCKLRVPQTNQYGNKKARNVNVKVKSLCLVKHRAMTLCIFLFATASRMALGPTEPAFYPMGTRNSFPGGKADGT